MMIHFDDYECYLRLSTLSKLAISCHTSDVGFNAT